MVTFPDAAAKVTSPAPFCTIITLNPAGNVSSGTVKEKFDELLQIKTFPLCDAARVVAPVIVTVEALKLEILETINNELVTLGAKPEIKTVQLTKLLLI